MAPEELDEAARESLNTYNAVTLLGRDLGLCKPYSFRQLQQDWAARSN